MMTPLKKQLEPQPGLGAGGRWGPRLRACPLTGLPVAPIVSHGRAFPAPDARPGTQIRP